MHAPPPAATARYRLDWQDALAYEKLPKSLPGLHRITLYLWLALAGVVLVVLPPDAVGEAGSPRFWLTGAALLVVQWAIFMLARTVTRLNRARRRYPMPVEAQLERDADHFVITENGRRRAIAFEDVSMLLPTANHLFMAVGRDLVIIPLVAFGDIVGMDDMVHDIDDFMRQKFAGEFADADALVVTDDPDLDHSHHL